MILTRLKNETSESHQRLEQTSATSYLMQPDVTVEGYVAILKRFYGFYAPFEAALGATAAVLLPELDFELRRKTPLLRCDLCYFGLNDRRLRALPRCRDLPPLSDRYSLLGAMYVLEGATLGGKLIARHLKTLLCLDATHGAAFFTSYGTALGLMWCEFRALLTGYAMTSLQEEAILQSATATYDALERWFAT